MKKFFKFLRTFLSFSLLSACLAGCSNFIAELNSADGVSGNMVTLTVSAENGASGARTALPDDVDLSDYTYTLSYTKAGYTVSSTGFSGEAYDNLGNARITIAVGTYTFTLDAYDGETKVLSGTVKDKNLSDGDTDLSFRMFTVKGNTAAVIVKLHLPTYKDLSGNIQTLVKTVKAGVSSSLVTKDSDCEIVSSAELAADTTTAEDPFVTFVSDSLKTGAKQFVIFYLYDAAGKSIGTIAESVVLVYGKTSYSEIKAESYVLNTYPVEIILNKDGSPWKDARKVQLQKKSDTTTTVNLTKAGSGTDDDPYIYTGSVSNSAWYVCVQNSSSNVYRNTGITLDTALNSIETLNYYTVTMNPGTGVKLESVSEVVPQTDGSILFLKGDEYKFKTILKDGYNSNGTVTTYKNGTKVSTELDSEISVTVDATTEISTDSADAISYSITYNIGAVTIDTSSYNPKWTANKKNATVAANVPSSVLSSYTVAGDFNLPTASDITCTGKLLDGWYVESEGESSAFSTIKADTRHENLVLCPKWKDAAATLNGDTLCSNGISLIICSGGTDSNGIVITNIYYDIDSDGTTSGDSSDTMLSIGGVTNFTGKALSAGSADGNGTIASNVLFTMTGGQLKSIEGLGKDAANTSTLNISGTAVIGEITKTTVTGSDGTTAEKISEVYGVKLGTFSAEKVNVTAALTSAQSSITVITDYDYDVNTAHYIASMTDTAFAETGQFVCYGKTAGSDGYYSAKTIGKLYTEGAYQIRLTNPESIIMPSNDPNADDSIVIVYDDESGSTVGFGLGADRINTPCSVLSISTTNGTFTVGKTAINSDSGLQYLAQTSASSYATTLDTSANYIYMHVMASTNNFTEGEASDFLEEVTFIPNKDAAGNFVTMDVKINIETVPYTAIQAMAGKSWTNSYDTTRTGTVVDAIQNFSYFDGSFYAGVKSKYTPKNKNPWASQRYSIFWNAAYDGAKNTSFNGLKGYLINITSEVENNYIFKQMGLGRCWTGGARFDHNGTGGHGPSWDADSWENMKNYTGLLTECGDYCWQSGPEAGQKFTTIEWWNGSSNTGKGAVSSTKLTDGMYSNWDSGEPNDCYTYNNVTHSEQCVHFKDSGKWNDFNWNREGSTWSTGDDIQGYIIEFTPYTTSYGTSGTPDYAPITKTASFNLSMYAKDIK